jgi:L-serine kinase (ATP) / ParB family transcriptional regulator, heme-responsive regulator
MKDLPDLPDLRILPTDSLRAHEHADEQRSTPLVEALRSDGVLRNPPIVLPMGGQPDRYVVLDGANRTLAFRLLNLPHVLTQVVHAGTSRVNVETWNHVVLGFPSDDLKGALEEIPEIALVPSDPDRASYEVSAGGTLGYLALADGKVFEVVCETEPLDLRLRNLDLLVRAYMGRVQVERTSARNVGEVFRVFPSATGLLVFRRFEIDEIVAAVAIGRLLPAGLTRFVVSPRALRVNYPLARLAAAGSLDAKQDELEAWVRSRVSDRQVRFYAEATFLFDE